MVDFATGPVAPGVFVVARSDEHTVVEEMDYLGMGAGPYYSFYRPYHLASIEAPLSIPPAVLDGISDIHPRAWRAEVAAGTKRPLKAGETIDGIGGECVYGMIDSAETAREERLVPLGLLAGARLTRDVDVDHILTYDDVELDTSTTIYQLRALQDQLLGHRAAGGGRPDPRYPQGMTDSDAGPRRAPRRAVPVVRGAVDRRPDRHPGRRRVALRLPARDERGGDGGGRQDVQGLRVRRAAGPANRS